MGTNGKRIIRKCRLKLTAPLYYLLVTQGYPRKQSLDLIFSHPSILESSICKNLANRCIHPAHLNVKIRGKRVQPETVTKLAIDLLNVTATIYAATRNEPVFKCTDGVVRDILSSKQAVRTLQTQMEESTEILRLLRKPYPNLQRIVLVIDSQIPWSKQIALKSLEALKQESWEFEVAVSRSADRSLIELSKKGFVIATSDIVVLQNIDRFTDIPSELSRTNIIKMEPVDLETIIAEGLDETINKAKNPSITLGCK
ncbi:MAG: DUF5616 domain-containing protein [Desulfurococcales archaeon]|nr:DUF5616 domain-containing protein [Desulfurococcales archaeon]